MKVVIAIDSLKGSMTSMEAGRAIKEGILTVDPSTEVIVKPLADGGEGTTEALAEGLGGEMIHVNVHGPLENPVDAAYGMISESKTAIMEMGCGCRYYHCRKKIFVRWMATTYGVGR